MPVPKGYICLFLEFNMISDELFPFWIERAWTVCYGIFKFNVGVDPLPG